MSVYGKGGIFVWVSGCTCECLITTVTVYCLPYFVLYTAHTMIYRLRKCENPTRKVPKPNVSGKCTVIMLMAPG